MTLYREFLEQHRHDDDKVVSSRITDARTGTFSLTTTNRFENRRDQHALQPLRIITFLIIIITQSSNNKNYNKYKTFINLAENIKNNN